MSKILAFDAHVDSLLLALELGLDLGESGPGHLDLIRAREGGLGAVVFACWVAPEFIEREGGAAGRAAAILEEFWALVERHPDRIAFAGNGEQLRAARAAGKLAGIPGIEGGHAIEESLERLEWFFERGVRVLTLVWNNHLSWVRSCVEDEVGAGVPPGLGAFGVRVVEKMNELGMVVDLSHTCERSMQDALEVSSKPVFVSHSGCKGVHAHRRNVSDEGLRALSRNGGVIGIPFLPSFLDEECALAGARAYGSAEMKAVAGASDAARHLERMKVIERLAPRLSVERLVDHVAHAAEVAGAECVGLGSDFDGIDWSVEEVGDVTGYGVIAEAMGRRGFSEGEIEGVMGGNMVRVFSEATGGGRGDSRAG